MITKYKFSVGDKVKFKSYDGWADWAVHKNEIGTIIEGYDNNDISKFTHRIQWSDHSESNTIVNNLILMSGEWDS